MRQLIRRIRSDESGFTIIELAFTAVILGIIAAPISAVMIAASAESAKARLNTSASQTLQAQVETLRTLPYSQVGVVNGNPPGVLVASQSSTLSNGTAITIITSVKFVNDSGDAYTTKADYKAVTITIKRTSDSKILATTTTNVSAASAPPSSGNEWVQIQRTVADAVSGAALSGATVTVTGGPGSITSTDTTDVTGTLLFPGLDDAATGTPVYNVAAALTGYDTYPDDLAPAGPGQVSSAAETVSTTNLRMYKGATLTVNLQASTGSAYTSGGTVSLESTRCGVATQTVPTNTSQVTFSTCQYANGKSTSLVPNLLGQTPAFDTYKVTLWNTAGTAWGTSSAFTVPSNYPTTLTQTATVKLSATAYTTKSAVITVKRGGVNDTNARVYITGGGAGVALYGVTNSSGQATFTIPVTSAATTFTIGANEQGIVSGSTTASWSSSTTSPSATVNVS